MSTLFTLLFFQVYYSAHTHSDKKKHIVALRLLTKEHEVTADYAVENKIDMSTTTTATITNTLTNRIDIGR